MIKSGAFLLILGLTACSGILLKPFNQEVAEIEAKEISDNFYRFLTLAKVDYGQQESIDIYFGELVDSDLTDLKPGDRALASCRRWANAIEINSKHWNRLSSNEKEIVVFHELGHCSLKKEHAELTSCKAEKNLMCPKKSEIVDDYNKNRNEYLRNFFGLSKDIKDSEIEALRLGKGENNE